MSPLILALTSSYLLGSIPTAYLAVKLLKQVDIRLVGSGNVGATNVTRAAGFKAGAAVFLIDVAKGALAARLIADWLLIPPTTALELACGLAAVLGHVYPVFLGFRGGKGFATMVGVVMSTLPVPALACLLVWLISFLLWRYASVSSMLAALSVPLTAAVMHKAPAAIALTGALSLVILVKHEGNIQRLLKGTEHRFERKNKPAGLR